MTDFLRGPKGAKGDPGSQGPRGNQGPKGPPGDEGAQGSRGTQGPEGVRGQRGYTGDPGSPGVKGDKGDQGLQGLPGVRGIAGPEGIQGRRGLKGDPGSSTAVPGDSGPKGDKGDQGLPGDPGPKGDKGDTGDQGAPGISGDVVTTVNTRTGAVVLSKTDVGLENVDNTADAQKPISTAQQQALSTKVNLSDVSATVVPSDIGAEPAIATGTTSQFWRGDKSWQAVPAPVVVPNVQGSSYTAVMSDAGKVIEFTASATSYFVIPANVDVPYPIGTVIEVFQAGTGQVNIGGPTIRSRGGLLNTAGQYASVAVRKRAADEWVLTGDVA